MLISATHAILIGTGVSYATLSNFDSVDGFGDLPAVSSLLLAVVVFLVLHKYEHSPKTHVFSLSTATVGSVILFLMNSEDQEPLLLVWVLGIGVVVSSLLLIKVNRKKS
ncbi:hypothetical protein H0X10_04410 [Candidatus Saccharibacteria bacterium]|nr:hypothetical protein [Candidatus Saccharibacteria bacterium]